MVPPLARRAASWPRPGRCNRPRGQPGIHAPRGIPPARGDHRGPRTRSAVRILRDREISSARAPCPGAGSMTSRARICAGRPATGRLAPTTCVRRLPEAKMAQPDQTRGGQHHRVHLTLAHQPQPRVDVAADGYDVDARSRSAGRRSCSCSARRGAPVPIRMPSRRSASRSPTTTSRMSSRAGTAATSRSSSSLVGRSFSECTATSTAAGPDRLPDRAGEDAGAADLGQGPGIDVTGGGDSHEHRRDPLRGQQPRHVRRPGPGPAGRYGHRAAAVPDQRPTSGDMTAATACGSNAKSSRNAAA